MKHACLHFSIADVCTAQLSCLQTEKREKTFHVISWIPNYGRQTASGNTKDDQQQNAMN